jgi:FAD/FMN-containing dehydrogenase
MDESLPTLEASVCDALRARLRGSTLVPGDSEYDSARRVWNGAIDRRPSCIIRCADAEDVSHTVRIAMDSGLTMTVRGGGHNVAGRSIGDGKLLLDLSGLRQVTVNRDSRIASVQGGALWRDVDAASRRQPRRPGVHQAIYSFVT